MAQVGIIDETAYLGGYDGQGFDPLTEEEKAKLIEEEAKEKK